jgi:hypothetical protein
MAANPFEPPKVADSLPKRKLWPWLFLAGMVVMIASAAALCGMGDFRQRGVSYQSAWQALVLVAALATSALGVVVAGLGWLISSLATRQRPPSRDDKSTPISQVR